MPAAHHSERFVIYCTKAEKKKYLAAAKDHDANSASEWARDTLNHHLAEDAAKED